MENKQEINKSRKQIKKVMVETSTTKIAKWTGILSIPLFVMPYFSIPLAIISLVLIKGYNTKDTEIARVTSIIGLVMGSITMVMLILALLLF